ncbi:MAG: hypothetical protein Pg6A_04730 [Termitinemataceae bacterium]|nr:MAG: hypothetical protein Pg6A_04730 [Termitinemataceae bacterium]
MKFIFIFLFCAALPFNLFGKALPSFNGIRTLRDNFGFQVLWSGFLEDKKNVENRWEGIVFGPFGLSFRAQLLDKRLFPPWRDWETWQTRSGFALYHQSTDSRVVYGHLENWGLISRTRNVWTHGASWFESHRASNTDLKTSISPNTKEAFYFNAGTPLLELSAFFPQIPFTLEANAHISSTFNSENKILLQGDTNFYASKRHKIHFEWLYSEKTLAERKQQGWFSKKPYLPAREMRFCAFNINYLNPFCGFSADYANSSIFSLGKGDYFNSGIRIGSHPWRVSFAADGATSRYAGENGTVTGSGFRSAARFEWYGSKNMRVLAETKLQSSGAGKAFDRSSSRLNFTFPVIRGFLIIPSRFVIELERYAQFYNAIEDKTSMMLGLKAGPLRAAFRMSFTESSQSELNAPIMPYPVIPAERKREEFIIGAEISAPIKFITLNGGISYKKHDGKEAVWNKSISATARGKIGRITIKIFNNEKEDAISYSLSWRLEKKF